MNGIHSCFFGRLGTDAELRWRQNGEPLLQFSAAVEDANAKDGAAEWVRVAYFQDDGEQLVERLTKGARVYVEGRLRLSEWTGTDGQARHGLNLAAWVVQPIGQLGRRGQRPAKPRRHPGYRREVAI